MTNHPIELSVVIPAFNEADNIPIVMRDTVATLDASEVKGRYELLLIDDGSSDDSPRIVDEMARQYSGVRALHHERNLGIGEALKTGYRNSRGAYVTFTAADGEIQVEQALRLYRDIGDADMITSSRLGYAEDNTIRRRSFYRGLLTWGFHLCARIIVGYDFRRLTGISMFRGPLARAIVQHSSTGLINLEILMYCVHSGAKMRHGEIIVHRRLSGKSKVTGAANIWKLLAEMVKLRRHTKRQIQQMQQVGSPTQTSRAA